MKGNECDALHVILNSLFLRVSTALSAISTSHIDGALAAGIRPIDGSPRGPQNSLWRTVVKLWTLFETFEFVLSRSVYDKDVKMHAVRCQDRV
jgi:hypothetical protein